MRCLRLARGAGLAVTGGGWPWRWGIRKAHAKRHQSRRNGDSQKGCILEHRLAAALRGAIVRALGLGGVTDAAREAREAAARSGMAAAAAEAAARRAEEAAQACTEGGLWYQSDMPFWQVPVRAVTESHDKMSGGMTESHDRLSGPRGATGRAWRELDNDIETLD